MNSIKRQGENLLKDNAIKSNKEVNKNNVRIEIQKDDNNNTASTIEYRRTPWRRRTRIFLYFLIHFFTLLTTYLAYYHKHNDEPIVFAIAGGTIGFLSAAFVLTIYHIYPDELTPPLGLLYWRSWCDLLLGFRFMLSKAFVYESKDLCGPASGLLEFAEISSEMWYLCVAVDLAHSFTNPFSSFSTRLKYYHVFVWTVALIFSLPTGLSAHAIWTMGNESIEDDQLKWKSGFCWVTSVMTKPYPWIFLYLPIVICFLVGITVLLIAYQRFKSGVALTLLHRLNILTLNFVNITCSMFYWMFLGILAAATASETALDALNPLILYIISTKGSLSVIVWILVSEVRLLFKNSDDDNIDLNDAMKEEILLYAVTGIKNTCISKNEYHPDGSVRKSLYSNTEDSSIFADKKYFIINIMLGDEELIERILIQAKIAQSSKRPTERQSISCSARDIQQKEDENFHNFKKKQQHRNSDKNTPKDIEMVGPDQFQSPSPIYVANYELQELDSLYEKAKRKVRRLFGDFQHATFYEFQCDYFRRIRAACHIDSEAYTKAFEKKLKARLTQGGASGALFFFSNCESFIAKSCSKAEREVVISNAKEYCEYIEKNPNTRIAKILGIYRLKIYGVKMNFFVMTNIFPSNDIVYSEKYDIKGSWIARNASPPKSGQKMVCMHCQKTFFYKKNEKPVRVVRSQNSTTISDEVKDENEETRDMCTYTVAGYHEPMLVMKDNDLKYKLNLRSQDARILYRQLKKDAEFLFRKMSVMDYSLLIGVQREQFYIQDNIAVPASDSSMDRMSTNSTTRNSSLPTLEVYKFTAPKSYRMGIIDFCQQWTYEKQIERLYKVYIKRQDKDGISAQDPEKYFTRFCTHIAELLNVDPNDNTADHVEV